MASRISSASSRWTVRFQSRRLSGSTRCAVSTSLSAALGRLAIRRRGHDQPVQRLEPPAARHELARQPVEQLGMRRRLAQPAEVARCGHEPLAEMILPDPVDDHPRAQADCRPGRASAPGPAAARSSQARPPRARSWRVRVEGPRGSPGSMGSGLRPPGIVVGGATGPTSVAVKTAGRRRPA